MSALHARALMHKYTNQTLVQNNIMLHVNPACAPASRLCLCQVLLLGQDARQHD